MIFNSYVIQRLPEGSWWKNWWCLQDHTFYRIFCQVSGLPANLCQLSSDWQTLLVDLFLGRRVIRLYYDILWCFTTSLHYDVVLFCHTMIYHDLRCSGTRVLALSTRVPALACSALACSALACSALTPMHFPGVHPGRYVCLDLDCGCFYWNRQNALEWR